MAEEYSLEICKELEELFRIAAVHRPMSIARYDPGTELVYEVTDFNQKKARVSLVIEDFVGGGFAGQVYRVKLLKIEKLTGAVKGLRAGGHYAIKILIPPSNFSRLFRNALYWLGFQGPFQLQCNPAAARAGALWQKFIRRAAKIRFGSEKAVADIYATFVDSNLGSCGEISEWVDGRTWQLEVDDRLDLLSRWRRGKYVYSEQLGSAEYRVKKKFMADFVGLLHDMGAYEFARQYEWWTCKSQPNCLKRQRGGELTAIDFRAGLALLPFLPMSPGDFELIIKGLLRGSAVQFDRGDIDKLQSFVEKHGDEFANMPGMLEELKSAEQIYRNSVPDITRNYIRLFCDRKLWQTICDSAVTGWKTRNIIDETAEQQLRASKLRTFVFFLIGLIPFLGRRLRLIWAREDWRQYYFAVFTSLNYLSRAAEAKMAEKVIIWHRAGRISAEKALDVAGSIWRFAGHVPLSVLPAGLHRFVTDSRYAGERLTYYIIRPVRLYFNAELREQWLRDMVTEGRKKHILSSEDSKVILSRINEPFIQKYLKSLAVHICTLPVTQIVSVTIAFIYVMTHPDMPRAQSWGIGIGIIALFQVVPISPGSLTRGLYVLYLVIRERNFKDYNIAVFLGFFKYVGYLAFPIQMAHHYPALARFMAGHWATEAVHVVPVFGEHGALLEHWVFNLFYNWPLTIRRRMQRRAEVRAAMKARYWHVGLCSVLIAVVFGLAQSAYVYRLGRHLELKVVWYLALVIPLVAGAAVTLWAGGAALWKRITAAAVCGVLSGLLYMAASLIIGYLNGLAGSEMAAGLMWPVFIFAVLSTIGAVITELKLPDPDLK